ncbi:MAG: GGDEF domain-containing protein [Chlorobium sp.]|nr:MAG: GGDEF domain-containing protein [Chlorobium sp.]
MNRAQLTIKKISPLQAIVYTGTLSLVIIIVGTVGFFVTQQSLLEKVQKKQACYLDLVDFRGKLLEFGLSRDVAGVTMETDIGQRPEVLLFMYNKILSQMREAGLHPHTSFHLSQESWPTLLAGDNLKLFSLELEKNIDKAKVESKNASIKLLVINEFFLFFILAVLLTLSITAGWMLHNNYRETLIPLAQLVGQLKLLNRNIPESIHDTAEEMKKELTEMDYSNDITQITRSIMNFCGDIEAKNKKLDEIYIRDEKTNLYNYRHFKEHLIIDVERAKRLNDRVSLAMIDIDHFKFYNDSNGHLAGDYALKLLADIISSQCRAYDVPSRFGGDEFALLFPKTGTSTARDIAERLRKIISDRQFPYEDAQPVGELTVSIGIATFPDDALDWSTLISNADRALYKAKADGRNNVVVFTSIDPPNIPG